MCFPAFFSPARLRRLVRWVVAAIAGILLYPSAVLALDANDASAVPQSAPGPHVAGPWRLGDQLSGGWQVEDALTHPEFLRYTLVRGQVRSAVEVIADTQPPGPWTTGRHRLQPGPSSPPDLELLQALMPQLRQWETQLPASLPPLLQAPRAKPAPEAREQIQEAARDAWQGGGWPLGLAVWLAVTALCWWRWLRRSDRFWLAGAGLVCAAVAAWLSTWPLPTSWLHALHESRDIFPAVCASLDTDGPLPEALRQLWPHHPRHWLGLPAAAHQQVLVAAVAFSLLAVWAQRRLPALAVLGLVAGLLGSPPLWRAVLSELPTAWLLLLGWSSLAPLDLWNEGDRWRPLALAQLLATSLAVLLIRAELGGALLVALAIAAGAKRVNANRLVQQAVRAVIALPRGALLVLALVLMPLGLATDHIQSGLRWPLAGMNPLHLSTLEAPLALATAGSPVLVALLLWALLLAGRLALDGRALPLAMALLATATLKTYSSAAHGSYYEIQRYVAMLAPVWVACGVLAAAHLWQKEQRQSESTGRSFRRRAAALTLASLALPPLPALGIWLPATSAVYAAPVDDPPPWQPLDRDRQVEARFVLEVAERYPDCALVAKVVGVPGHRNFVENLLWTAVGPHHPEPVQVPEREGPQKALAELRFSQVAGLVTGRAASRCVVQLRLLDCHRAEGVACPSPPADAALVMERRWTSRPYLAAREHGAFVSEIHLAAWLLVAQEPAERPFGRGL